MEEKKLYYDYRLHVTGCPQCSHAGGPTAKISALCPRGRQTLEDWTYRELARLLEEGTS